jgi:CRP-like cAMP-binding protein
VAIDVLRRAPMLRALPAVTIEHLARHVEQVSIEPGAAVCVQGEHGDRFYVIESGEAEVLQDGVLLRTLSAGDFFGEIALIRDAPRTATVLARTTINAWALTRARFLPAITGFGTSARLTDAIIDDRLTTFAAPANNTPARPASAGEQSGRGVLAVR